MPAQNVVSSWRKSLDRLVRRSAADTEQMVDVAWRRLNRRLRTDRRHWIDAYRGFGDGDQVVVRGRVLSGRPPRSPGEDDQWWDNLANTWRRWESDERPGVRVKLRLGDCTAEVTTDEEGYYHARLTDEAEQRGPMAWRQVMATVPEVDAQAIHRVMVAGTESEVLVISDIDDTVLHTDASHTLQMARLTFLGNARTRQPLLGVSALYHALVSGGSALARNPLAFVSSSPWNLYDLLTEFMELNDIPAAPLVLRDYGIDQNKLGATRGHGHKRERVQEIMDVWQDLPVVLMGDSGQEDPEIYADIVRQHGDRVKAVYIRDVDNDLVRADSVDATIQDVGARGVPMIRSMDSTVFAEHAHSIGLIPATAVRDVRLEVERDRQRSPLGLAGG